MNAGEELRAVLAANTYNARICTYTVPSVTFTGANLFAGSQNFQSIQVKQNTYFLLINYFMVVECDPTNAGAFYQEGLYSLGFKIRLPKNNFALSNAFEPPQIPMSRRFCVGADNESYYLFTGGDLMGVDFTVLPGFNTNATEYVGYAHLNGIEYTPNP